jgi:hypothetical protein
MNHHRLRIDELEEKLRTLRRRCKERAENELALNKKIALLESRCVDVPRLYDAHVKFLFFLDNFHNFAFSGVTSDDTPKNQKI